MLIERVKIDMRRQDIAFFEYGPDRPQALYLKSRFMHPSMMGYETQKSFDSALEGTGLFDFDGFGPPFEDFVSLLRTKGFTVKGFELRRRRTKRGDRS